jgi:uncharacterized membrane protein
MEIEMVYLLLKLLHIIAVILFLGNIITGWFWKFHADRTTDPRIIAHAFEGIIRSDRWFTIPGVIVITLAGIGTAVVGQYPLLRTGWILWSIILFAISGMIFSWKVAPLQARIAEMARAASDSNQMNWDLYRSTSRAWEIWGFVALLLPVAAVALMVIKPSLPAL